MKKGFLKCTGQRSMEPVEPSVFIYVTVYRWLTVNKLVGWGVFLFPWQMGPSLSLSLSLSLCPGSAANTNHTERVVLSAGPWLAARQRSGLSLTPWVVWPCKCL